MAGWAVDDGGALKALRRASMIALYCASKASGTGSWFPQNFKTRSTTFSSDRLMAKRT